MRLTRLAARDVLSYASVELVPEAGLTIVTGPNGSGKSNLGRLVDLAIRAVSAGATNDWRTLDADYAFAGRYGGPVWEVRVGVALDRPDERELVEDWARAALLAALAGSNPDVSGHDQLLADDLDAAAVFTDGEILVRRDSRRRHPWIVGWQSHLNGNDTHMRLWSRNELRPGVLTDDVTGARPSLVEWLRSRDDILANSADAEAGQRSPLRFPDLAAAGGVELVARPAGLDVEVSAVTAAVVRDRGRVGAGRKARVEVRLPRS